MNEKYTVTSTHRAFRSIRAKTNAEWWIVLGGTEPWADESHPPKPLDTITIVNTPIVVVKATLTWVKPSSIGSFSLLLPGGLTQWEPLLTTDQVLTEKSNKCIVTGIVMGVDIPEGTKFREVGIVTGLVPNAMYVNETILTPDKILDFGMLEFIHYRKPGSIYGSDIYRGYRLDLLMSF